MTRSPTMGSASEHQGKNEDWTCSVCGCEIMVKHTGDSARMSADSAYACRCGTRMQRERPGASTRGSAA